MDVINKTPLWLQLRKEYIDDNFDELKKYLSNNSSSFEKDSFYQTTIALLRNRIEDLLITISSRPIFEEDQDRKLNVFNASLLATYLLVDGKNELTLPAYIAFLGELQKLTPRFSGRLFLTATNRLKFENVIKYGFSWGDLGKIGTELFSHNVINQVEFSRPRKKPLVFNKNGTAHITADGLFIYAETTSGLKLTTKNDATSLDTGINIAVRTAASDKLKQRNVNNLQKIEEFITSFVQKQCKNLKKNRDVVSLKSYFIEDEVIVRIYKIDKAQGIVYVETVDPAYHKLLGKIVYEKSSIVYYYTNSLYSYFNVGDYLKATIKDLENDEYSFSIEDQLVKFFVEDTKRQQDEYDNEFLAKLIDVKPNYYGWVNEFGVGMYTSNSDDFERGDFALLSVVNYNQGSYYGKIDAEVIKLANEDFDEKQVRHDCIRDFAEETSAPVFIKQEESSELSPIILSLLIKQMYDYQQTLLKPSERFSILATATAIAELKADKLSSSYLKFARTYLRALVQFVSNGDMKEFVLIPDDVYKNASSTQIRLEVINLLKEYGNNGASDKLTLAEQQFKDSSPMLSRLARLINTSNAMQGTLSNSALSVIKREIIKMLSIETEKEADLEGDGSVYLGVESGTQEFKTSMVYPSDNHMQPDENRQNENVLKGVCAFLNSTIGGTLYLGVNDQGYVVGIENDKSFLKIQNTDSYTRYVNDTIKRYFGLDTLQFIHIEPLFGDRVIAIHIEPHPYRVVELNNTAYLRVNAESREMNEVVRQQLIDQKVFKKKDTAAAISFLQHACSQKKCVVLHDYSSSHSGKVSDRFVEAYDIKPEDGLAICYDREKCKISVFKINRIKWVEIKENEPWLYIAEHKPISVDVFHMTGETPIDVSIRLDLFAKSLLVEEFPNAESYISKHKGDDNIWYFDTKVYAVEGIGRFCAGLSDHIEINNSPELKDYLSKFTRTMASKYLS
ncbi:MAG: putative DNA binding domain-containing protein [Muribaculaceae bacterium]|nr:putative DNA binding domain-containing protein [Muribaculaceae bacterium]